jgi:hypothetical protein
MASSELVCSMCSFFCSTNEELLSHLVKRHRSAASFIVHCNMPGCGASYRNYLSFKSHVYSKHAHSSHCGTFFENNVSSDTLESPETSCSEEPHDLAINTEAAFVLKLNGAIYFHPILSMPSNNYKKRYFSGTLLGRKLVFGA